MKLFALVLSLGIFSLSASAQSKVCSATTPVCASFTTETPFSTTSEGRFELFLEDAGAQTVTLVKADLWMQMGRHGHGSAPLIIVQRGPGHFDVTRAFFVMKGAWQIRVTYEHQGTTETLVLPVTVTL